MEEETHCAAKTRNFSTCLADFRRGSRRNFPALALGSDAALAEKFSRRTEPEKTLSCFDLRAPTPRDNQRQHVKLCGQEREYHRRKKRPQRPNLTQYDGTFSRPCQSAHDRANQLTGTGENQLTEHGKTESENRTRCRSKMGIKVLYRLERVIPLFLLAAFLTGWQKYHLYSGSETPNTQESETPQLPSMLHNSTRTRTLSRPCVCPTTDTKRDAAATFFSLLSRFLRATICIFSPFTHRSFWRSPRAALVIKRERHILTERARQNVTQSARQA